MSMLATIPSRLKRTDNVWKHGDFPSPWDSKREPIFAFLKKHTKNGTTSLPKEGQTLPDDAISHAVKKLRWSSGALDGAFGHHAGKGEQTASAEAIHNALATVPREPSERNISVLYK